MSVKMKKPERVEVGQWWVDAENEDSVPWRISTERERQFGERMLEWDIYKYLGSGPHPEPSEWMIETLAEHLYVVTVAGITDEPMSNDDRVEAGRDVRAILQRQLVLGSAECHASVLSLYRILRSLGKW